MVFGKLEPGRTYAMRPGAYGVLVNADGRMAVVDVMDHWLLPGGGLQAGESAEQALRRELREELGIEPLALSAAVEATELIESFSGVGHYIVPGRYFRVSDYRRVGDPTDTDHRVLWVDPQTAAPRLCREGQAWALGQLLARAGSPGRTLDFAFEAGTPLVADPVGFWSAMDVLAAEHDVVIDRPRGSSHPLYPQVVYPVDYGYLKDTRAMDGNAIDVWVGSMADRRCVGVVCTLDLLKRDSEIKLLLGCADEEIVLIMGLHNGGPMRGLLVTRGL